MTLWHSWHMAHGAVDIWHMTQLTYNTSTQLTYDTLTQLTYDTLTQLTYGTWRSWHMAHGAVDIWHMTQLAYNTLTQLTPWRSWHMAHDAVDIWHMAQLTYDTWRSWHMTLWHSWHMTLWHSWHMTLWHSWHMTLWHSWHMTQLAYDSLTHLTCNTWHIWHVTFVKSKNHNYKTTTVVQDLLCARLWAVCIQVSMQFYTHPSNFCVTQLFSGVCFPFSIILVLLFEYLWLFTMSSLSTIHYILSMLRLLYIQWNKFQ